MAESYAYHEFGESMSMGQTVGESALQPFGFTGYRKDEVSGTYFAQAREYLPEAGRFASEDRFAGIGRAGITLNRYCYNNPMLLVDIWKRCFGSGWCTC